MKIKSIQIRNYKAFRDSQKVQLNPYFNVIVGQNNAGKTALLEGLRLWANDNKPFRGVKYEAFRSGLGVSEFTIEVSCVGHEVFQMLKRSGGQWYFPVPMSETGNISEDFAAGFIDKFFGNDTLEFLVKFTSGNTAPETLQYPSHGLFTYASGAEHAALEIAMNSSESRVSLLRVIPRTDADNCHHLLGAQILNWIYVFRAERTAPGTSQVEDTSILRPDAANLPSCLLKLSGNSSKYERFNAHVSDIFPSVKRVVVVPSDSMISVRLWTADPATERDDLLIRLEESGTGVGQVLAILYVAMTKDDSIIAIDEPGSFLHPGAAKKLAQILKLYPKNQYIISSHSPEVIKIFDSANIIRVYRDDHESFVRVFSNNEVNIEREILMDIGVSISDVFGTEKIVWVEGPTEEIVFPIIAENVQPGASRRISFIALRNTGEIESRKYGAIGIWEIYTKLSSGAAIMPPDVRFSFDRELRSDTKMADIVRQSSGRASFLPRRMLENYFLIEVIIRKVLDDEAKVYEIQVNDTFNLADFLAVRAVDKVNCDGANILNEVFNCLTQNRIRYSKTKHSVMLAQEFLMLDDSENNELKQYVATLL